MLSTYEACKLEGRPRDSAGGQREDSPQGTHPTELTRLCPKEASEKSVPGTRQRDPGSHFQGGPVNNSVGGGRGESQSETGPELFLPKPG